jgi:very-short-patch-repair endonuclease
MAPPIDRSIRVAAWARAREQDWVISGEQLRALGFSPEAIQHRLDTGRLHRLWRDVFSVGRPQVTDSGRWIAATLACGEGAALSHESAGASCGMCRGGTRPVHVSVPPDRRVRLDGIKPHRRDPMPPTTTIDGIRMTIPLFTIVDLAAHLDEEPLTKALNDADRLGLVDPDELFSVVESLKNRRGIRKLRSLLGDYTRTDSNLERRLLDLARQAGLPRPQTQADVHGQRVDFYWPELKLVVETDGLTYHRTAAQQAVDRKRDQILTAAGLRCVRFPNAQVRDESAEVIEILRRLAAPGTRLRR